MKRPFLALAALALACGGHDSTPTGGCSNVAGAWTAGFTNSCGFQGSGAVTVAQSGCNFSAAVQGVGTVSGTISGSSATFTLHFSNPCSGTATGSGTFSSNSFNGTFSGHTSGGFGCCEPVSGSFTLFR